MREKIKILKDLKNQLTNYLGDDLVNIYLFGSQTKIVEDSNTDCDALLVIRTSNNWETKGRLIDICYEIDLKHDIIIDAHILSESELNTIRGHNQFL